MTTTTAGDMEVISVRVKKGIKRQAMDNAEAVGIPLSTLLNAFITRFAAEGVVPFSIRVPNSPNAETAAAIREARDMLDGKTPAKRQSVEDFFANLYNM